MPAFSFLTGAKAMSAAAMGLALGVGTATAEANSERLEHMLQQLPATAALPDATFAEIQFFDVEAGIASLGFDAIGVSSSELLSRSVPRPLGDNIFLDIDEGWPALVGFAPLDLRYGIVTTQAPASTAVLVLKDKVGAGVPEALLANRYEARAFGNGTAYGRLDDYSFDIANRDPLDPFDYSLGVASRVLIQGNVLYQARSWDDLAAISAMPSPSLADLPPVDAIFAALDDARFAGHRLVRANLVTDPTSYHDPMAVMRELPETAEEIDALMEGLGLDQGTGLYVPMWTTGLYADLANPSNSLGVFIMAFADRASAEAAQQVITLAWTDVPSMATQRTYDEIFGGVPEFVITGDSPAALSMILTIPHEPDVRPWQQNMAYDRLMAAYYRRDMPFLAPTGF